MWKAVNEQQGGGAVPAAADLYHSRAAKWSTVVQIEPPSSLLIKFDILQYVFYISNLGLGKRTDLIRLFIFKWNISTAKSKAAAC